MIMTNSSMNTMAGMAGGGLVVSSTVNKPLTNTTNMMAPGQPHHPGNHTVPQQVGTFFVYLFLFCAGKGSGFENLHRGFLIKSLPCQIKL